MHQIDLRKVDLNLLVVFQVLMQERNVTRAAERLGRTQSAMSHALARLRDQLGDPLLVKTAKGMRASPYAESLVDQVRPILADIQRVLTPVGRFEPASSHRVFRLAAPDLAITLFPALLQSVQKEAPFTAVEWTSPSDTMQSQLLEGRTDLAIAPAALKRADGLESAPIGELQWACFGRRDHPAWTRWGAMTWSAWPHAVVRVGDRLNSPVAQSSGFHGLTRRVGAWLPHFSAVGPLLAHSDLLATLPTLAMADAVTLHGLSVRKVPFAMEPMPHVVIWSARHGNDPAVVWLRSHLVRVWQTQLARAHALMGPRR